MLLSYEERSTEEGDKGDTENGGMMQMGNEETSVQSD